MKYPLSISCAMTRARWEENTVQSTQNATLLQLSHHIAQMQPASALIEELGNEHAPTLGSMKICVWPEHADRHAYLPPENSVFPWRERESCYIIWSRSALTCSDTPKGRSGFSVLKHFGTTSQSYECRTSLRFTTTCPDRYANAQHTITYMHSQITGLQLLVLLEARICKCG